MKFKVKIIKIFKLKFFFSLIVIFYVFDRKTKCIQRNAAASRNDFDIFCYVKDEFGARIADRVFDLIRFNEICVDLGCGLGHISPHLIKENVGMLIQCDMSHKMVEKSRSVSETEVTKFNNLILTI